MRFIADLHIHSHFSRATSRDLVPEQLAIWAQKKGIQLLGSGDFTHPGWVEELRGSLVEAGEGVFRLRPEMEKAAEKEVAPSCRLLPLFVLSGEVSCIYKRGGKTRKIHHLILMPGFESLERLNRSLARIGNIKSDGRPILGLDSKDLLEIVLEADDRAFLIPAHIWTPWFSLFGSKSGFDDIEECFADLTPHVRALETGLSSDPPMNRLLSRIDGYVLVSNSDAHSPAKLGREANLFETEMSYDRIVGAMSSGEGFLGTIEFFPEEGKYHLDGHRKCGVSLHPEETREHGGLCPTCGRGLTVGVLNRVHELADREEPVLRKNFFSLIPLQEILSEILSCGPSTAKVLSAYEDLLARLGPELKILLDCPLESLSEAGGPLLAEGIRRMRLNQVIRTGGYDGEYGVIKLFRENEKKILAGQFGLFAQERSAGPGGGKKPQPAGRKAHQKKEAPPPPANCGVDPLLDPLNPEQKQAVLHREGHLLIVAGPGTGKTLTLTHRIAHLIRERNAAPEQVLALTFTNKAAREMAERIRLLLGEKTAGGMRISTFHGFCVDVLRLEGEKTGIPRDFILCSEWDARALAEQIVSESGLKRPFLAAFLKQIPFLKRSSVLPGAEPSPNNLLPVFHAYQERLRESGMLDLDDLEVEALRLFQSFSEVALSFARHFPWVFVDEYQDTNPVEVAILKSLAGPPGRASQDPAAPPCVRICAIGDPDQAIYGFRGAEVRSFHAFEKDFPGAAVVRLVRNYRSTQRILDGVASVIGKENPLKGQNGPGDLISLTACRTAAEEAETVVAEIERLMGGISYFSLDSGRAASHQGGEGHAFGDVAVLFRLNAQGEALEEAFSRAGIPFVRSGEKPLVMQEPVHTLWRFLLAAAYPGISRFRELYLSLPGIREKAGESILRSFDMHGSMVAVLERAVGAHEIDVSEEAALEALRRLKDLAACFEGDPRSFLDRLSLDRGIDHQMMAGDRVSIMSLHASKGLEWPVVFITGCEEGLLPCTLFGERDDEEEEKRLFYVGMTRARKCLILSHANSRFLNGRTLRMNPSPFLTMIPEGLCAPLARQEWKPKKKAHRQLDLF